jgi:hypothetical protein
MRERVGATPTPSDREDIRAADVQALDEVADIKLDTEEQQAVYRPELDHGGMSAGTISVTWWRETGIPLLVDRSDARRPAAASPAPTDGRAGNRVVSLLVWALVLAIPLVALGAGVFLLVQRTLGTSVQATVLECSTTGSSCEAAPPTAPTASPSGPSTGRRWWACSRGVTVSPTSARPWTRPCEETSRTAARSRSLPSSSWCRCPSSGSPSWRCEPAAPGRRAAAG